MNIATQKAIEYLKSYEADGKLTYLWADENGDLLVANCTADVFYIVGAYAEAMFQVNLRHMSNV